MGKDKTQTTETKLDPSTQAYVDKFLRPLGQQGADAALGGGPLFTDLGENWQQGIETLGSVGDQLANFDTSQIQELLGGFSLPEITGIEKGVGRVSGNVGQMDPNRAMQFMSPYEEAVVQAMNPEFDRRREWSVNRGAQEAVGSGAFGGSRSGLLQAQGLRDANQDAAAWQANLRNTGYQQALGAATNEYNTRTQAQTQRSIASAQNALQRAGLNQAGQIAQGQMGLQGLGLGLQGLGMGYNAQLGALGQRAGIGQGLLGAGDLERQVADQQAQENIYRHQQALGMGNAGMGPYGQTTTQTQQGDLFGDIMGMGMTGLSFFNPFGGGGGERPDLWSMGSVAPQVAPPQLYNQGRG